MDTSIKLGICLSVHFLILSVFSFSSLIKQHDTFWIKTVLEGIKLAWQDKQTFIGFQLWKNERILWWKPKRSRLFNEQFLFKGSCQSFQAFSEYNPR